MFRLKLEPLRKRCVEFPGNPAYLQDRRGVRIGIYTDITDWEWRFASGALVIVVCAVILAYVIAPDPRRLDIAVAVSASFAFGAVLLVAFARRIAVCDIHLAAAGAPLPEISRFRVGPPAPPSFAAHLKPQAEPERGAFTFHIAVKETEPNVSARLAGYADGSVLVMRYADTDQALARHLVTDSGSFPHAVAASRSLARDYHQRRDIWPVVRLILGRILYRRTVTESFHRIQAEDADATKRKGSQLYFTYKLHLLPVAYWFLVNAAAFALLAIEAQKYKDAMKYGVSLLPIIWAMCTIYFHGNAITRWRRWLAACDSRPLGSLPMYLHIFHNEERSSWEELDEYDFRDYVDEYVLDSESTFNVIIGSFALTSLGIYQLM